MTAKFDLFLGGTALAPIENKGVGVVALRAFARGVTIEENRFLRFDAVERRQLDRTRLKHYVYLYDPGQSDGDVVMAMGNISFCNHSAKPNADAAVNREDKTIRLYALRDIDPGDEITIDYDYPVEFDVY